MAYQIHTGCGIRSLFLILLIPISCWLRSIANSKQSLSPTRYIYIDLGRPLSTANVVHINGRTTFLTPELLTDTSCQFYVSIQPSKPRESWLVSSDS